MFKKHSHILAICVSKRFSLLRLGDFFHPLYTRPRGIQKSDYNKTLACQIAPQIVASFNKQGYNHDHGDGNGYGDGNRFGFGDGYGFGDGNGDSNGNGNGFGFGDGEGDGSGNGNGFSSGNGYGNG